MTPIENERIAGAEPPPSTGLAGLDRVIDGLRLGDNVVFQVETMADFRLFLKPYVKQALAEGRTLVHFQFGRNRDRLVEDDGLEVHTINPDIGFEQFLITILDVIEAKGERAFYVFDCLSDLAVDWYSDTMLANFFMITCPFLCKLDTIAYFAVLRDRHLPRAVDDIVATAQVNLNVYRLGDAMYVQPIKVDQRHSPTMYTLHRWEDGDFVPATNSATLTEIMSRLPQNGLEFSIHRPGVWARTFLHAQDTLNAVKAGRLTFREADDCFHRLLRMAVTRDPRYIELAERYFDLEDLVAVLKRMIGPGRIGGKTLGMLLARAMLRQAGARWHALLEEHDSFFIGSDVFYTYLVQNDCWWLRRRQRDPMCFLDEVDEARQRMLGGAFPEHIERQFVEMLQYFGQSPLIVRSSSLLEDNYGNAFSGKYESVFCPNQGSLPERLVALKQAIRQVYASAMSRDALVYRHHRGLLDLDEQMALLVQRVSGGLHGNYFFPHAAGVGFSFNPYVWDEAIDPEAGVLRLVLGLGTRAVDRLDDDYTRLVSLNAPRKRLQNDLRELREYSQQFIDVLDLATNQPATYPVAAALAQAPAFPGHWFLTRDEELADYVRQSTDSEIYPNVVTFDQLLADSEFVVEMREMLALLEDGYDYPVDVEFTVNFVRDDQYRINVVQCRPFQVKGRRLGQARAIPDEIPERGRLLETRGPIIGHNMSTLIDRLIYVHPPAFARLSQHERYALAREIGMLTRRDDAEVVMLIGPGRWGTSSPSFGVPTTFPDIKNVSVICEMAVMHEGLMPDISLGTHFFNDLVELGMTYLGIFPTRAGYLVNDDLLLATPNRLLDLRPGSDEWTDSLKVLEAADLPNGMRLDVDCVEQRAVCYQMA